MLITLTEVFTMIQKQELFNIVDFTPQPVIDFYVIFINFINLLSMYEFLGSKSETIGYLRYPLTKSFIMIN